MENRLLACLAAPGMALLEPHLQQVRLVPGAVLHDRESPAEWVYFPLSGAVSLLAVMARGDAVEIASIGREGAVGLFADFGPWKPRARAVVQVAGLARAIPLQLFRTVLGQSRAICDLMLRWKEALLEQSQQMAACNALHSVEERLARWLLQMSDRTDSAELPVTQDMISQMLGVRRTTVTLVAHKLQQDGAIRQRRGCIGILNPTALRALACECYEAGRQTALVSATGSFEDHGYQRPNPGPAAWP